jgi:hypothetical protein
MRPPVVVVVGLLGVALAAAAGAAALGDADAGSAGFFPLRNRENMRSSSWCQGLAGRRRLLVVLVSQLRHSSGLCAIASAIGTHRG